MLAIVCEPPHNTYRYVKTSVTGKEGDGTHEIFRSSHLSNGNQGRPLLLELWVVIENLLGPAVVLAHVVSQLLFHHLQSREHVSRRDAVDANPSVCPLDG